MGKDLYKILGLERNASTDEIRKAYRKLALKCHPDKNKTADAIGIFQSVNNAYEILSDPKKKEIYDKYGEEGLENIGVEHPFGNPFGDMMNGFGHQQTPKAMKHNISLEELFTQTHITINIRHQKQCDDCDATGYTDRKHHPCKQCGGTGMMINVVRQGNVTYQTQITCQSCRGMKTDRDATILMCHICNGIGSVDVTESVQAEMPRDIMRNSTILVIVKGPMHRGK